MGGGGGIPLGIEFIAEALLVPAGDKPGAGGTADRIGNVAVGATDAGGGEAVEVRRGDVAGTLKADVAVAEIVRDDDENVGATLGGMGGGTIDETKKDCEESGHDWREVKMD